MPAIIFEIGYTEDNLQDAIKEFDAEKNPNITRDLDNVRKLIQEGLKTIAAELTIEKTNPLQIVKGDLKN